MKKRLILTDSKEVSELMAYIKLDPPDDFDSDSEDDDDDDDGNYLLYHNTNSVIYYIFMVLVPEVKQAFSFHFVF